jgi:hypothetical protein
MGHLTYGFTFVSWVNDAFPTPDDIQYELGSRDSVQSPGAIQSGCLVLRSGFKPGSSRTQVKRITYPQQITHHPVMT